MSDSHAHSPAKHAHDHAHAHATPDMGRAFLLGIGLNALFIAVEILFGLRADSLALLADAGHNVSDVIGLALAWGASLLARRPASERFTYGMQSGTILAALANAMLLLIAVGAIAWEAIQRFSQPQTPATTVMMAVAAVGILVNGVTAWLFLHGQEDLNVRGAFLHMLSDAAVSAGVVVSGLVIAATGWQWLDPAVSLAIAVVIVLGTWGLLRDSIRMAMQAVPRGIEPARVRAYLAGLEGVGTVHDLHIWAISTTQTALSVHLAMPEGMPYEGFLHEVARRLEQDHRIGHATIQVESGAAACTAAPHPFACGQQA